MKTGGSIVIVGAKVGLYKIHISVQLVIVRNDVPVQFPVVLSRSLSKASAAKPAIRLSS